MTFFSPPLLSKRFKLLGNYEKVFKKMYTSDAVPHENQVLALFPFFFEARKPKKKKKKTLEPAFIVSLSHREKKPSY